MNQVIYDYAQERVTVVEDAQRGFAFAIQAIRDNDCRASEDLLTSMQETFDNLARVAKAVVA